jgi:hypothetical protein
MDPSLIAQLFALLFQLDAGCAGKLLLDWKSEGPIS